MKAGFVALIGEPNAGKSTLTNLLVGEKVSIVSPKPQTTRQRVTGILNIPVKAGQEAAQVVFVDAPGFVRSKTGLNKFLEEEAGDVIENADVALVLLPADGAEEVAERTLKSLKKSKRPWVAIVTKADLLVATQTPKFFKFLIEEKVPFVSISAQRRPEEAKEEVLKRVIELLPESKAPLFEEDLYTTQTLREMTTEIIRERCFENLSQEVPYGLAVLLTEFKENQGPIVRIRAEVIVEKDNHKGIVIGAKGQMLKKIGSEARAQIEKLVGRQVFLELHVSVKKAWAENKRMMKELGYVIRE